MHFVTEEFLLFAVGFIGLFFLVGYNTQKLLLLGTSYLFCGFVNVNFALLLMVSTLGNHASAVAIERDQGWGRIALAGGILFNVAILGTFKYFDFFSQSFSDGFAILGIHYSAWFLKFAVPLGLSFYTFQAISYLFDLRAGKVTRASLFDLAIIMSFWPKFVAGPIIRVKSLLPQLQRRRTFRWANLWLGLESIVYGLCLKTVLSDYLAPQVQKFYAAPAAYGSADALIAAIFFTFQIYGDFAGYSLVVIGLSRILGYSVQPNFRRPNFARSFSDFWSRWHISLSSWLDDYVFRKLIPKAAPRAAGAVALTSVADIYRSAMELSSVEDQDTFSSLAGDSLSFVEVALALEEYLEKLPEGWERMTIRQLESLKQASLAM